jgi:RNA polymerase sigma factor (sigma-70 family)
MGDQINRLLRASHQLTQELGRDPTVAELAESLNVTVRKAEQMIQVARRPISLETPTDDEEESVLGDFIPDDDSPAPAEMVTSQVLREQLSEILDTLPPREVRILQLRYGLLDGETYTLEEVGRKLGVTRERVRQIEAQALSRLRLPAHARRLRDVEVRDRVAGGIDEHPRSAAGTGGEDRNGGGRGPANRLDPLPLGRQHVRRHIAGDGGRQGCQRADDEGRDRHQPAVRFVRHPAALAAHRGGFTFRRPGHGTARARPARRRRHRP